MEDKLRIILITGIVAAIFLLPTKTKAQSTSTSTSTPLSSAPGADDLIITEIMYNPQAVSDSKGEWFEIYNSSNKDLDLQGCIFSDNDKDDFNINQSLIIKPNNYLVLGKNNNPTENGGVEVGFVYSGFTLANSEDEIIITCNEQEIDRVEYGKTRNFPDKAGRSLNLADYKLNNNLGENWCLSTSSFGQGDKGTPGKENDPCQTEETKPPPPAPSNLPPVAEAGPDQQGTVGEELWFDASSSFDPDGDRLQFSWDFGDGTTAKGEKVSHTYQSANVYLVVLTVDDGTETETDSLTVQIITTVTQVKDKIIINELMPNPAGSDEYEWIELKNASNQPLNIENFSLSDATNKKYTLKSEKLGNLTIPANGFFIIYKSQSRISLNNTSAEIIKLYDRNQNIIDQVIYEPPVPENQSLSLIKGEWHWTKIPTPATNNILVSDSQLDSMQAEKDKTTGDNTNQKLNSPNSKPPLAKEEKQTKCPTYDNGKVVINELWPSPQGNDRELEFIELKNIDDKDINLCGWQLADKNHTFIFGSDTTIEALDFLVLPRSLTKISLNNNGDEIKLLNPQGMLIDSTTYNRAPTNDSWSRKNDGSFAWTEKSTPWEENEFTVTNNPAPSKPNSTNNSPPPIITDFTKLYQYPAGSYLSVEGIVSVPPYQLGGQLMYISFNNQGLQLYKYDKNWPELNIGDVIRAKGRLSFVQKTVPRLKIKNKTDVKKIKSLPPPSPLVLALSEIDKTNVHALIKTNGEIIDKEKNKFIITDMEGNDLEVQIKPSTGIKLSSLQEGDIIEVTGVLTTKEETLKISPRFPKDIKIIKVKGYSTDNTSDIQTSPPPAALDFIKYIYALLIITILTLLIKIYQLKKNYGQ